MTFLGKILGKSFIALTAASLVAFSYPAYAQMERLDVVVASVDGEDMDPMLFRSAGQTTYYPLVFDALITKDPQTGELAPGLAESWSLDADGKSWVFKLRQGVKFHDGSDFTAEDAKFTIDRYIGKHGPSAATSSERIASMISSVDIVDDYTIVIRSETGAPTIPFDLAAYEPGTAAGYVVPRDYIAKVGAEEFNRKPIGTGPFRFVRQDLGRNMEFEANPDYWNGAPSYERLSLRIVPELAARMAQLRSGEADIVSGIVGPAIPQVQADPSLKVVPAEKGHIVYMIIGGMMSDTPFAKPEVRQALSMAIDRQAIVQHLLFGQGDAAHVFGFPFAFGWPADAGKYVVEYDPEGAKTLLAEAGYPDGFDITLFAATEGRDFAQAIAQYLEAVGVRVKMDVREISQTLAEARNEAGKQQPRLVLIYGATGSGARADTGGLLHTYFVLGQPFNQPHGDEELSQWVIDQTGTPDPDKRKELIENILRRAAEINAIMPLYYADSLFAVGESVASWQPIPGVGYPSNLAAVEIAQ
ncbi:ABC transporter substrate-binding protein [Chelativorans sp. Marseille-P2723]|uniref:ABC transporter substrate-binding protein n=1 Tax=Chelativorans sp. Marseille-P2723 TaxID=2709133 RepID=UPI00156F4627|nr:ABC transporter substrate-binding protein [Chelativorans sp. Marseille-P2723]